MLASRSGHLGTSARTVSQLIEELNREYAVDNSIYFHKRRDGLLVASVRTDLAAAEVTLQGAQLVDFRVPGMKPILWLSDDAKFQQGIAIRGGVPICWPWFGMHPHNSNLPQHGFARTSEWQVVSTSLQDGVAILRFRLAPHSTDTQCNATANEVDDEVDDYYEYKDLLLEYEVKVGSVLSMNLITTNHGVNSVRLTQALHSYFCVGDIDRVSITGLDGRTYFDKTHAMQRCRDIDPLRIESETDRVYLKPEKVVRIRDESLQRVIAVSSPHSESCVIWNPWIEKARSMSDFSDNAYKTMVCVESTHAMEDARTVEPGQTVELVQTVEVE